MFFFDVMEQQQQQISNLFQTHKKYVQKNIKGLKLFNKALSCTCAFK
jgi:hypothetical protein